MRSQGPRVIGKHLTMGWGDTYFLDADTRLVNDTPRGVFADPSRKPIFASGALQPPRAPPTEHSVAFTDFTGIPRERIDR